MIDDWVTRQQFLNAMAGMEAQQRAANAARDQKALSDQLAYQAMLRAQEEQKAAESKRMLKLCTMHSESIASRERASTKRQRAQDIESCGSIAAGFTGTLGLQLGPVTVSGSFSPSEKIENCRVVVEGYVDGSLDEIDASKKRTQP